MLSAARARRSCPQCRRQILNLLARGFAHERQAAPTFFSPRPTSTVRARIATQRYISTTPARLQEPQPDNSSKAKSTEHDTPQPESIEAHHQDGQPEIPAAPKADDIETIVRQARRAFGDTLPKGYLNEEEYKIYERLYGAPLRETRPEDVGMPLRPTEEETEEYEDDLTVQMRQNEEGSYEEAMYLADEADPSTSLPPEGEVEDAVEPLVEDDSLPSDQGLTYINAVAKSEREYNALLKLQKDFEKASLESAQQEAEAQEEDEEPFEEDEEDEEDEDREGEEEEEGDADAVFGEPTTTDRIHPYSQMGHWRTHPKTIQLPRSDFVNPISRLLERTDTTHLREAAEKHFGGVGLPLSVVTPAKMKNAAQKPIPLPASSHKMSQIDADVFLSTMMPGLYASTMSILVEIRKRLGTEWMARLFERGGGEGPRVLDIGGGGAGLAAWESVLRAEWDSTYSAGGAKLLPPSGKKTVVIGSETLRQRVSRFLHNTTFLPRLPDYLHSGPLPDKLDGGEIPAPRKQFDVIIASHIMLPVKDEFRRREIIDNLWEMLSPEGGVLIIKEKGHPRGFEAVADVRARLLDEFIVSPTSDPRPAPVEPEISREREPGMIIAPCTNHKACPMYLIPGTILGRKDFCSFSQRYIRPPFLQKIRGASHQNHDDIGYSFVAIQRGMSPGVEKTTLADQGLDAAVKAFKGYEKSETAPDPLSLPRNILQPLKRRGHVTMDLCTPAGTLERWTVPKSFSKQAYRDARKARWGDLWALGAKTRVVRPIRLGRHGPALDDGGVRARQAAQGNNPRNITMEGNKSGIFRASDGKRQAFVERRTKGGRKPKLNKTLLDELKAERPA